MESGLVDGESFAVDASVIKADARRFHRVEGSDIDWSEEQLSWRAIREYIEALESENSPLNPDQKPKALSATDPMAAWTTRGRHKVMFGYSLNYLIDMEHAVMVNVDATPTRLRHLVRKCVAHIHALMVLKECSTVSRRTATVSGF